MHHFSHISLFYWVKYLNTADPTLRRKHAARYDTYINMSDDGYDEIPSDI